MEKFFEYQGGRIHYGDTGNGEIIVLIHGYLETSEIWKDFAARLSKSYRVITPDLPGHGLSDIYGEEHTMEFMATVIKNLIRSEGAKRIFLAGHSLGGYVTIAFTDLFPEMLSGYCLFHSHPFADSREALEKRKREIEMVKAGKKDLFIPESIKMMYAASNLTRYPKAVLRSEEIASSIQPDGITAVLRGMMSRPSRLPVMEEGRIPLLWILGAGDNFFNYEQIRSRVKLPSNAKTVVLDNSGHMGFIEEEERSVKIIDEFVKGLKVNSSPDSDT